jgi:hypothetical protein
VGGCPRRNYPRNYSCLLGMDYFKGKVKKESKGKSRIQGVPFFYRCLLFFS